MSVVVANQDFLATANILGGVLTAHLPKSFSELSLGITVSDFGCSLVIPLVGISSEMELGQVVFKAAVDSDSKVVLTLVGELFPREDEFRIYEVGLNIETATKLARSDFVLTSLRAMFSLADQVLLQIPEIQLDLSVKFSQPLLDISQMLRRRQIAFRIMVIERATRYKFHLPIDISGEEVGDIAFLYHASVERCFDWPIDSLTVFFPATEEWLNRLTDLNQFKLFTLGPDLQSRVLFGKQILLGDGTITVLDKHIEDFDKVQRELSCNDGHTVPVVIRSLSGHGRYELPEAPTLPVALWDSMIQGLIDVEAQLDAMLVTRYHALAASTLEGLTEQEKTAITTRPELDEKAFLE
jgi:hypothetical protein